MASAARLKWFQVVPSGGCAKFFCAKVALAPALGEPCAFLARPQYCLIFRFCMFSCPVFVRNFVTHTYTYTYMYIYIHLVIFKTSYRDRGREREREKERERECIYMSVIRVRMCNI